MGGGKEKQERGIEGLLQGTKNKRQKDETSVATTKKNQTLGGWHRKWGQNWKKKKEVKPPEKGSGVRKATNIELNGGGSHQGIKPKRADGRAKGGIRREKATGGGN